MNRQDRYAQWMTVLILLLILSLTVLPASAVKKDDERYIMILHSYHPTLKWTADIQEGIFGGFGPIPKNTTFAIEYLDWKNFPYSQNLEKNEELLRFRYGERHTDLLITTDDAALIFCLQHRDTLFSNAPIVFTGLNGFESIQPLQYPRVTGVIEAINPEETLESIFHLLPDTREVLVLCEYTESGQEISHTIQHASERFTDKAQFTYVGNITTQEVLDTMRTLEQGTVVLIGSWSTDHTGTVLDIGDFAEKVAKLSPVPVFNLYDFNIGRGTVGGSILSAYGQGYAAGEMARDILAGKNPSSIPVIDTGATELVFDHNALERFGIPVGNLPEGSTIINQPPGIIEQYFWHLISAVIIIIILFIILAALVAIMIQRRKAEQLMTTLLDALPGYTFLKDLEGRYQIVSQTLCETVGLTRETIKGKTDFDLFPPATATEFRMADQTVIATGEPLFIPEESVHRADGMTVPVTTRKVPVFDSRGVVTGVIGLAFDISEQKAAKKELQESHEKYYNLFELGKEAILLIDRGTGEILEVNSYAVEMYGYSRDELLGLSITTLSAEPEKTVGLIAQTGEGPFSIPVRNHMRKDGQIFPVEITGRFFEWKGRKVLVASLRDISERVRDQEALRKATEKVNLFNYLTRTTLNNQIFILRGYLEFASDLVQDTKAQSYLQKSGAAVRSLERMVVFMKNYQDLGLKPAIWQNVEEVFIYAISHISMSGITRHVNLDGISIYADPFLEKVFQHLVENSTVHGQVNQVSLRYEVEGADLLLIYEDDGVGIHPDNKEQIFSSNFEGKAGIGLILVREILSITGITIVEDGEYGKGAKFVMRVPHSGFRCEPES